MRPFGAAMQVVSGERKVAHFQRWRASSGAFCIVMAAISGGCGAEPMPIEFEPAAWRALASEDRDAMIRSLMGVERSAPRRNLTDVPATPQSPLFGLSKVQVIDLLGEPDAEYDYNNSITYGLGFMGETGYLEEKWSLNIRFNSDNVVEQMTASD